jgi:hypothetical protein
MDGFQSYELDAKFYHLPYYHESFIANNLQRMDKCVWQDHLCEEPKYEHRGRLEVKIHSMFYGGNSWYVTIT